MFHCYRTSLTLGSVEAVCRVLAVFILLFGKIATYPVKSDVGQETCGLVSCVDDFRLCRWRNVLQVKELSCTTEAVREGSGEEAGGRRGGSDSGGDRGATDLMLLHTHTLIQILAHIKAGRRMSLCFLWHTHTHTHTHACTHLQSQTNSLSGSDTLGRVVADVFLRPSRRSQPRTSAILANPGSLPAECHRFSATSASFTSQRFTDPAQLSSYWWELSRWRLRQITSRKPGKIQLCVWSSSEMIRREWAFNAQNSQVPASQR